MNLYTPEEIRVWLCMDLQDDLKLVAADVADEFGNVPNWAEFELSEMGWHDIVGVDFRCTSRDADGNEWPEGSILWGLQNGIAPGQPFLVELPMPVYSKHWTDCGYEYDTDYHPEIVRVLWWTPARIATAWDKWMKDEVKWREAEALRRRKLKELQQTDVGSMFLSTAVYFSRGTCDDMAMPDGIRYSLQTSASLEKKRLDGWSNSLVTGTLAQGSDDGGDHEKALVRLVAEALKLLPHLAEAQIRKMPVRHSGW